MAISGGALFAQNVQTMDFNELAPSTSFASTQPHVGSGARAALATPGMAFNVCHVGVVLRVVLGVQALVALGVAFQARGLLETLDRWSQLVVVSLPASLLWLALACAAKHPLSRWGEGAQGVFAVALGAAVGGLAQVSLAALNQLLVGEPQQWGWPQVPAALAGAAMAAVALVWLRQRARSVMPAQAAARLAELQARIRPHFLFNTLNTAIALVQIDPQRAERVLEDLAELFRQALQSPSTRTTLGEEIALARRYLDIEALRFGDRLRVRWDLDPAAGAVEVPILMLQPLVENAVHHGVEVDPQGGWIDVRTRVEGGRVLLTIRNSVPVQLPLTSRQGHGMALRNVRQRLRLLHDVAADFDVRLRRSPDGQTPPVYVVKVVLPAPAGGVA